ncbi:HSCARG dehydrogenase [Exophiala viscosa]|uniref:HSCARG dehydrogenase n=1 Tax=Exophiala viscosa TaxID=2486360 RepID=A0AAN6IAY3_9EURO|nr:HSCARG dehydrogenase [Exophiala viscosa]KAI1620941.1 HSCARG dehydrogenase [Exophiala viscosa]
MSKVLAVFGATGQQGGSIVDFVLEDAQLSKNYKVRGITRDTSSEAALRLKQKGVDVLQGDVTDPLSLNAALKGAHTVFALTAPAYGPDSRAKEFATGKAIADAAVAEEVQYIILSTLPNVSKLSTGKYTNVTGFDAKADVEDYIRKLSIKSAFFAPASFMQNFQNMPLRKTENGGFIFARPTSPSSLLPLIDIVADTGKFVGAILADLDKYEGKTFCAATRVYSMTEIAGIISAVSGKEVKYVQVPPDQYRQMLSGQVGNYADVLVDMMLYQQEFGYYGPQTKELVQWAVDNATGKVTSFEEYLEQHPLPSLQ